MQVLRSVVRWGFAPCMMIGLTAVAYHIVTHAVTWHEYLWLAPLLVFAYACERRTIIALLPDDVRLFVDLSLHDALHGPPLLNRMARAEAPAYALWTLHVGCQFPAVVTRCRRST